MDDIADILASVSGGPLIPPETLDLQALTRAWVNERTAPELLPYPAELVDRTMARVARQVCVCFCLTNRSQTDCHAIDRGH
jgi:GINS complex subunit 4